MDMKRRYRMIDKKCIDCGAPYQVASNVEHRSERCKPCRLVHHRVWAKARNAEAIKKGRSAQSMDAPYKVIVDPDESWGYQTRLKKDDINWLKDRGQLTPGTVFLNERNGTRHIIIELEGLQQLKKLEA
jgi:endogenous inhibitor of DNA gyrase (YacG/DUF329 family)